MKTSPVLAAIRGLAPGASLTFSSAPDGFDALIVADAARALAPDAGRRPVTLLHIARDGQRMAALEGGLAFAAPDVEVLALPAWDCQPYDRVGPSAAVSARRMTTLARLARPNLGDRPRVLLTTVNAALQRVAARGRMASETFAAAPGDAVDMDALVQWLERNGFTRASAVRDVGDYAVRGGIVDLWPAGLAAPVRLDFFGDTLETLRTFDPETQRTVGPWRSLDLVPMSEVVLTSDAIRRFRQAYLAAFGATTKSDPLYEAISEGRRYPGLEHWLPLFTPDLDTLFDYVDDAPVLVDALAEEAATERLSQIADYHEARTAALAHGASGAAPYKPLAPDALYASPDEWRARLAKAPLARLTPFALPPDGATRVVDCGARQGRSFAPERADDSGNVFDAAVAHIRALQGQKKRVIVAAWSDGSRERLRTVLADHGLTRASEVAALAHFTALRGDEAAFAVWGLEAGFETADLAVDGEQDILGDRLVRAKKKRRGAEFIAEAGSLSAGDLVVHVDHGIARFLGLKTIEVGAAPHDCAELEYAGGDKLFLPVENIELLSRYGSDETGAALDRLGGGGWQARKARLKERIREMAGKLMAIAAQRALKEAPRLVPPDGLYDEFRARFPYEETDDQQGAIDATLDDLGVGRPMDRLICGDVGFGKTEVALRAAFAAALNGKQVAVVVPTTLLARQHHKTFSDRFKGLPVQVAQASRFVPAAEMKKVKEGLESGAVDIVVGTHALLGKAIRFRDLALVIVDEEQHFGVAHKEKLKELRAEVHVLTLSATPIPRTLQLAMTGVRDLSIIATPPVDRLTVRTFVTPFDSLSVREAILRERYRGGQTFYVCPRIDDIADARDFLVREVPEAKFAVAHGQMAATQLEDVMTAFYEGKYDVLLSTAIVESGLDIPTANTLIVHRADMFGLAQLYQLRGRVGRSKTRAYALFTVPPNRTLTAQAEKRLKVLQSLDTLGAGFQLASHDLDIRGAGNLLGEEQSGHIKEVGYELYQQMLEETIAQMKAGVATDAPDAWSPTIAVGAPVVIPEQYVSDLDVRMSLYRRLAAIEDEKEIEQVAAELADRFGRLPAEVEQLLKIVAIKTLCRRANVAKVEAGPKGIVVSFRDNTFTNPAALVQYVARQGSMAKVRPDMSIVFIDSFDSAEQRLKQTQRLLRDLVGVAEKKAA
jgi:transcription-repair coupling factor (superfamily II helicase)